MLQDKEEVSRLRFRGQKLPRKLLSAIPDMDNLAIVDLEADDWSSVNASPLQKPADLDEMTYLRVVGARDLPDAFTHTAFGLPSLVVLDLWGLGGTSHAAAMPALQVESLAAAPPHHSYCHLLVPLILEALC